MCGNDANTYDNMCHLHKATCMTGIQLAHVGKCMKKSTLITKSKNGKKEEEECPKNCDNIENNIVCGSDGNAYKYVTTYIKISHCSYQINQ